MSVQADRSSRRANRSVVTEEALSVSPELLGLPLASSWRRGGAMLLDLLLCAILANAPSVLFGLAAAWVLLRVSARRAERAGVIRRSVRFTLRASAALVLFVAAVSIWGAAGDRIATLRGDRPAVSASVTTDEAGRVSGVSFQGMDALHLGTGVAQLFAADDEAAARSTATSMLSQFRAAGLSGAESRESVRELAGAVEGKPWVAVAVESVLAADAEAEAAAEAAGGGAPDEPADPDALVVAYAAALTAGDSVAADSLRPGLVQRLAADTVAVLTGTIEQIDRDRDELRAEVAELEERAEEGPGILALLGRLAEDLGLGFGWFTLYFTAATALWHGQTPGKRLFGVRVISLTGKPIGWWAAFERFGGYAAGPATGLLGFAQILWDDNRQAIHDKIANTVVIRDRRGARSRPES